MFLNTRKIGSFLGALVIAAAMLFSAPPALAQTSTCGARIIVGFGDTLAQIARRCGTTMSALMAANPLANPNFLFPGMSIVIPRVVAAPPPGQPGQGPVVRYVVRPGDTLTGIARANNVTMADIYRLNPDIDARTLRIGDVVRLPGGIVPPAPPPGQGPTIRYVVNPGDTLSSIARRYSVTTAQIVALNPGLDPRFLRVGQVIRLPGGIVPPTPAREAVAVAPSSGRPGAIVQVTASGYPARTRLKFLAGRGASTLVEIDRVTTDARGRATLSARIPQWAARSRTMLFAFETADGRRRALSPPFRVTQAAPPADDRVTVTGTLTREGAECQAMRGDDGRLYTLTGDLDDLRAGDRVRVQGRIAEVSFCMQGTTIDVRSVEILE